MAGFYVSISNYDIATQVAHMINTYNKWYTSFSAQTLIEAQSNYFVEIVNDKVVGCASLTKENYEVSKIQHICVLPLYRGRGIAKKLTNLTINHCDTQFVYMTVREDNIASIKLALSLGFLQIKKHWFRDHWTLTFGRRKEDV